MLDTRSPSGENLSTINFVVAPPLFVLLSGLFVSQVKFPNTYPNIESRPFHQFLTQ